MDFYQQWLKERGQSIESAYEIFKLLKKKLDNAVIILILKKDLEE